MTHKRLWVFISLKLTHYSTYLQHHPCERRIPEHTADYQMISRAFLLPNLPIPPAEEDRVVTTAPKSAGLIVVSAWANAKGL